MNYSTAVMLINKNIRAVKLEYQPDDPSPKIFKTLLTDLKIGDFVVVESDTRFKMTTVKVIELDCDVDFDSSKHMGWVVGKINVADHDKIRKLETEAINLIRKGELKKRKEEILKNTLDAVTAEDLAKLEISTLGTPVLSDQTKVS